ncbi:MAG: hypothetical protein ABI761_00945 [Saprospiraceae bacterium]
MAKTFTKQEPVSISFFGADQVDYGSGESGDEEQSSEILEKLKNLRFRPSLSSVQLILLKARNPMRIAAI